VVTILDVSRDRAHALPAVHLLGLM